MDQNRNQQNPGSDKDRNRPDQSGGDDRTIGQQRDRNPAGDRDVNDVNSGNRNRSQGQGDRSGGAGGSQTNR